MAEASRKHNSRADAEEPIFSLAWDCDDLIQECLGKTEEDRSLTKVRLEDYERRFNAWWEYLGVFAGRKANLDRRLHHQPEIRDIVVRLLHILKRNFSQLKECLSSDGPSKPNHPAVSRLSTKEECVDIDDLLSLATISLEAIDESLTELSQVGIAIRQSSRMSETVRARMFAEHLDVSSFEALAFLALETLYPNAPESLLDQLGRSMVDRYIRILFRAPRQNTLKRDLRQHAPSPASPSSIRIPTQNSGATAQSVVVAAGEHGETRTIELSSIDKSRFKHEFRIAQTPRSRSGTTIILANTHEPPIPRFDDTQKTQCQWCFTSISQNVVVNDGRWSALGREHYRKDLEPFPCVSEDCAETVPTFSSIKSWRAHMLQHSSNWTRNIHQKPMWRCDLENMHESEALFSAPDHFRGHVRALHQNVWKDLNDMNIAVLAEEFVDMPRMPNICPLCCLTPKGIAGMEYTSVEIAPSPITMESHIAKHLQGLMVLSLRLMETQNKEPYSDCKEGSLTPEGSRRGSLVDHSEENSDLSDISLSPFGSPIIPPALSTMGSDGLPDIHVQDWSIVMEEARLQYPEQDSDTDSILNHLKTQQEINSQLEYHSESSGKKTVKSKGLNIWSSEFGSRPAPDIDIILVQGLGAHPFYTWTKNASAPDTAAPKRFRDKARFWKPKNTNDKDVEASPTEVMWPRDLLVSSFQNARVATYSYEFDWRDRNFKTSLRQCANQFLNILLQHRKLEDERQRPLLLIGHSLGGLVIQQALVIAVHQKTFIDIRLSTAGIIFLGAPFRGSDIAVYGKWIAQFRGLDSTLLESLTKDSSYLHDVSSDFWHSYNGWDIVCFYENKEAAYGPLKTQVVNTQSASILGTKMMFLNTDHSGLNKFSGENDSNYMLLLPEIQRIVREGPAIVFERYREKYQPNRNIHWMVPRTVNTLFTGRTELLKRIQMALDGKSTSSPTTQRIFVITGLGGLGKSEVSLNIANLMREKFWGVFWIDVYYPSIAESAFINIAKRIGSAADDLKNALQVLTNTKENWLIILNNADDPNFDYHKYIPSGAHGAVIITSRIPDYRWYNTVGFEALTGLDIQQAKELLFKAADIYQDLWPSCNKQAERIVELLGSHTLALIQAGAYIAKSHSQLEQYPEMYLRQRKRLRDYKPKQGRSTYCDIYCTFEASVDILERSDDEAAKDALQLLEVLSMLHYDSLPTHIFEDAWKGSKEAPITEHIEARNMYGPTHWHVSRLPQFISTNADIWDAERLVEASSLLASLSLITQDDSFAISMHPSTHAWAKDRQSSGQQNLSWIAVGCIFVLSGFGSTLSPSQERQLQPHMRFYLNVNVKTAFSFGPRDMVITIFLRCGWFLSNIGDDSRLSHLLDDLFTELCIDSDNPSKEYLPIYGLKARRLVNIGLYERAIQLQEQIITIKIAILAANDPDLLESQHDLAVAYNIIRRSEDASNLLEQIVKIKGAMYEVDHPSRLSSQHELADAYRANGQIKEAIVLLEHLTRIREMIQSKDHPERLASQHQLALAYQENGQIKEAIELLEHVVKVKKTTLADNHPSLLSSQHNLASTYQAIAQTKEAIELLEHVVKMEKTTLADNHPNLLTSQHNLASAYQANGQIKEAIELLEHVVKVRKTTFADNHPSLLASQHQLALAYRANGQTREAIELLEHVVNIQKTTLAEDHPNRIASEENLAICLKKLSSDSANS